MRPASLNTVRRFSNCPPASGRAAHGTTPKRSRPFNDDGSSMSTHSTQKIYATATFFMHHIYNGIMVLPRTIVQNDFLSCGDDILEQLVLQDLPILKVDAYVLPAYGRKCFPSIIAHLTFDCRELPFSLYIMGHRLKMPDQIGVMNMSDEYVLLLVANGPPAATAWLIRTLTPSCTIPFAYIKVDMAELMVHFSDHEATEKHLVVSYSLYGKFPSEYHSGLEQLAPLVVKMYPEWVMRIYLDLSLKQQREWACNLACNNQHIDLCDTSNISGVGDVRQSSGTSWRFCVVGDPLVERYIVRDADSPILQREVDAVDDWISSGKCFHVMRDNAHHGVSMVAGTWGGCNTWQASKATPIRDSMLKNSRAWNQDQPVLWVLPSVARPRGWRGMKSSSLHHPMQEASVSQRVILTSCLHV
nr:uncharacterized protein LOC128703260 [Cherax quadricarinatus]